MAARGEDLSVFFVRNLIQQELALREKKTPLKRYNYLVKKLKEVEEAQKKGQGLSEAFPYRRRTYCDGRGKKHYSKRQGKKKVKEPNEEKELSEGEEEALLHKKRGLKRPRSSEAGPIEPTPIEIG